MAGPAGEKEDKKSAEEGAVQWPPADYREFVQAQVANKMLLKLSGIGLTALVALSSAYVAIQNLFNAALKAELTSAIKREVGEGIPGQVSTLLVQQTKLVDEVKKRGEEVSKDLVQSPDFQKRLNTEVFKGLEQGEALQTIILTEAWKNAKDGKSDPVRSLGLQLYALFHGGERTSADKKRMRENFVTLAEADEIPMQTLGTILKYYPMGERGDAECKDSAHECDDLDRRMVVSILKQLGSQESYFEELQRDYLNLLSKTPLSQQHYVSDWMKKKEGQSKASVILTSWARVSGLPFRESAVRIMAGFVGEEDEPLRMAGLRGLAAMGPDVELRRGTRAHVLSQLLRHTSRADKDAIVRGSSQGLAPSGPGLPSSALVRRLLTSSMAGEAAGAPPESPNEARDRERRELVQKISVNLLHTALRDKFLREVNEPSRDNDWDSVVLATVETGGEPDSFVLRAWSNRISGDSTQGLDVSWAADIMLGHTFVKNPSVRQAYANVIPHASWKSMQSFAGQYFAHWKTGGGRETDVAIQAIWKWFDGLARRTKENLEIGGQTEISKEFISQIMHFLNAQSREIRWRMVESIEESNMLAHSKTNTESAALLKPILAQLRWYGNPLDSKSNTVKLDKEGAHELPVETGQAAQLPAESELWWNLIVAGKYTVDIEPPKDAVLVAFDKQRTAVVRRGSAPGQKLILSSNEQGEYVVTLRNFGDQPIRGPIKVVASTGPIIVGPAERSAPHKMDGNRVVEFQAGEGGGSVWLAIPLAAGVEFKLETRQPGLDPAIDRLVRQIGLSSLQRDRLVYSRDRPEILRRIRELGVKLTDEQIETVVRGRLPSSDTMIWLYDAETGQELDSNDDGGSGLFSKLTFVNTRARNVLVRVAESFGGPFQPGVRFEIEAKISKSAAPVTASPIR